MPEILAASRDVSELESPRETLHPWRYGLRSLFMLFVVAAIFLSAAIPFLRWTNSRPGKEISDPKEWPHGLTEIERSFGPSGVRDIRAWHLYGGWFAADYVWRATVSREALANLQATTQMKVVSHGQIPTEFWKMPPDWYEMPKWWDPKPVPGAEYYMSPTFIPRRVSSDRLDCCAMYDPDRQMLYVWSQWDF